jgi:type IV pilus assembly protein PilO
MTYADQEFIPAEGQEEAPNYPTAFGITFTPRVGGIIIGVLGLLGATYLLMNVVQPTWQEYQDLQSSVKDKEAQIQGQQKLQQQIKAKQAELAQAKQQNKQVLALFTNEKALDTLLLDINSPVKSRNGTLVSFKPKAANAQQTGGSDIVNDGSLGPLVNGKLKRERIDVELKGSFDQVQSILRSFERLQTLLLIRDYKAQLDDDQGLLINVANGKSVPAVFKKEDNKVIPGGKPTLRTTFTLEALSPVTDEETKDATTTATQKAKK